MEPRSGGTVSPLRGSSVRNPAIFPMADAVGYFCCAATRLAPCQASGQRSQIRDRAEIAFICYSGFVSKNFRDEDG
jgi:hypothetical protein